MVGTSASSGPGDMRLSAGSTTSGRGGSIGVAAGFGTVRGGLFTVQSGAGTTSSGKISLTSGQGVQSGSIHVSLTDDTEIASGSGVSAGSIRIAVGSSSVSAGDIALMAGASTENIGGHVNILSGSSSGRTSGSISVQSPTDGSLALTGGDSPSGRAGPIAILSRSSNSESGSLTFMSGNDVNINSGENANTLPDQKSSDVSFASGVGLIGTGAVTFKTRGAGGGASTGALGISGSSISVSVGVSSSASGGILVAGGSGQSLGGKLSVSAHGAAEGLVMSGGDSLLGTGGAITVSSSESESSGVVSIKTSFSADKLAGRLEFKAGSGLLHGGSAILRAGSSVESGAGGDVSLKTQPTRSRHPGDILIKGASGGEINLKTGSQTGSGESSTGSISLISGSAFSTEAAEIGIHAGGGMVRGGSFISRGVETLSFPGGRVSMNSGDSSMHGGHVRMETLSSMSSTGAIQLNSGDARNGVSGGIYLEGGHASRSVASISVIGHHNFIARASASQALSGGRVDISGGSVRTGGSSGGSISVQTGAGDTDSGSMLLESGSSDASSSGGIKAMSPGNIALETRRSEVQSGGVRALTASTTADSSGDITLEAGPVFEPSASIGISPGSSDEKTGGSIHFVGGPTNGAVSGGDMHLRTANGIRTGRMQLGTGESAISGSVRISTGASAGALHSGNIRFLGGASGADQQPSNIAIETTDAAQIKLSAGAGNPFSGSVGISSAESQTSGALRLHARAGLAQIDAGDTSGGEGGSVAVIAGSSETSIGGSLNMQASNQVKQERMSIMSGVSTGSADAASGEISLLGNSVIELSSLRSVEAASSGVISLHTGSASISSGDLAMQGGKGAAMGAHVNFAAGLSESSHPGGRIRVQSGQGAVQSGSITIESDTSDTTGGGSSSDGFCNENRRHSGRAWKR